MVFFLNWGLRCSDWCDLIQSSPLERNEAVINTQPIFRQRRNDKYAVPWMCMRNIRICLVFFYHQIYVIFVQFGIEGRNCWLVNCWGSSAVLRWCECIQFGPVRGVEAVIRTPRKFDNATRKDKMLHSINLFICNIRICFLFSVSFCACCDCWVFFWGSNFSFFIQFALIVEHLKMVSKRCQDQFATTTC